MKKEITCICCPLGCPLTVELADSGAVVSVTGQTCRRGEAYGAKEATAPERSIAFVVPVEGRLEPLSVKTAAPVPKTALPKATAQLRQLTVTPPVAAGDTVLEDLAGTGVAVVATKEIP